MKKIAEKDMTNIQKLVGEITESNLKYVEHEIMVNRDINNGKQQELKALNEFLLFFN